MHRGITRIHEPIKADYIKKAACDIADFIYSLELKINSISPKSIVKHQKIHTNLVINEASHADH